MGLSIGKVFSALSRVLCWLDFIVDQAVATVFDGGVNEVIDFVGGYDLIWV